ncbi:MAG TPA: hypothetical protein VHB21_11775, partial [Minicystis sp.]|nr:hypothetical protein [Minicystis sp.]
GAPSPLAVPEQRSGAGAPRAHTGTAMANEPPAELRDVLPFLFDREPARADAPAPAPAPAPDPKPAAPAASPAKPAERSSPWAPQAATPEPPKPKPAPPPPGPAAALSTVKKGGYDRFKR